MPPKPWETAAGGAATAAAPVPLPATPAPVPEWERAATSAAAPPGARCPASGATGGTCPAAASGAAANAAAASGTAAMGGAANASGTAAAADAATAGTGVNNTLAGGLGSSAYGAGGMYGSGSMYGSGYGSGMYGGGYGSSMYGSSMYGSGYGGYGGGMYGGMGGMYGGGPGGMMQPGPGGPTLMDSMQMIAQSFARLAAVLDQNLFALRGTFFSAQELMNLLAPVGSWGPMRWIADAVRFILNNLAVLAGLSGIGALRSQQAATGKPPIVADFERFNRATQTARRMWVGMAMVLAFGLPLLLSRLAARRRSAANDDSGRTPAGISASTDAALAAAGDAAFSNPPPGSRVRSKYAYEGQRDGDVSFAAGEAMVIINGDRADGWWEVSAGPSTPGGGGSGGDRRGLIPSNFVEVIGGPQM